MTAPYDKVLTGTAKVQVTLSVLVLANDGVRDEIRFRELAQQRASIYLEESGYWNPSEYAVGDVISVKRDPPADTAEKEE